MLNFLETNQRILASRILVVALILSGVTVCSYAQSSPASQPRKTSATAPNPAKSRKDVARFASRVETALNESHAQKAFWGILVVDRDSGETLYELNADRFFTPASNAKIFTTSLALATLGPNFRFRTTLESGSKISADGHLAGDVTLVGRGDPDLSNRKFPYAGKVERDGPVEKILAEMADEAAANGLKEIDGDIVADGRYSPYDPYPAGWSIGDIFFTFGSPIGAIALNDNCISVSIVPGAKVGDGASILVEPAAASETFARSITTSDAPAKPEIGVVRQPGPEFLLLHGSIPVAHAPIKLELAMPDPAETAGLVLKQIFESRGIRVTGTVRVHHAPPPEIYPDAPVVLGPMPAPADPNRTVLAEHLSLPLIESVRLTNKVSQNLHAELLLRAVAYEKKGFGVTDAGLWVEQDFLKSIGVADGDVVLLDGSGLARDDLVTPRATVQLLRFDVQQLWGSDYISTLPVAGADGSLDSRMKGSAAAGRVFAKTGGLDYVHSLAGFATTEGGERLVFSIFENNNPQPARDAVIVFDSIAVALVETLGAKTPSPAVHSKHK